MLIFAGCLTVAGDATFFIITRFFSDEDEMTGNRHHALIAAQCFGVLLSTFGLAARS